MCGLLLACGGATKQTAEQPAAGASAGGAGSSATTTSGAANGGTLASAGTPETSGGNAASAGNAGNAAGGTAGAAPIGDLNCFKPEELPPDWYAGGAAGAANSECPVAPVPSFGYSYCYFWLADVVPGPTPPDQAGTCCYFLDRLYCR